MQALVHPKRGSLGCPIVGTALHGLLCCSQATAQRYAEGESWSKAPAKDTWQVPLPQKRAFQGRAPRLRCLQGSQICVLRECGYVSQTSLWGPLGPAAFPCRQQLFLRPCDGGVGSWPRGRQHCHRRGSCRRPSALCDSSLRLNVCPTSLGLNVCPSSLWPKHWVRYWRPSLHLEPALWHTKGRPQRRSQDRRS